VTAAGACAIAGAIVQNKSLRRLDMHANPISNEGSIALAEALGRNQTLFELNIAGCVIGTPGAQAIATSGLLKNYTLRKLDLEVGQEASQLGLASRIEWMAMCVCFMNDV